MAEQTERCTPRPSADLRCDCDGRNWDPPRTSGYQSSTDARAAAAKLGIGGAS